jgi:hypothetical protein
VPIFLLYGETKKNDKSNSVVIFYSFFAILMPGCGLPPFNMDRSKLQGGLFGE